MEDLENKFIPIKINVLGPFELIVDGCPVSTSRARVRDLLALLASRPNEVVTYDALIDSFWSGDQPKEPRAALRVIVSRARSAIDPHQDRLSSEPHGLRLDAKTDWYDFRHIAASSTSASAKDLLAALALWRGRPFEGVAQTPDMLAIAANLTEARLGILVQLSDTMLALKQTAETIMLLGEHVAGDPTQERLAINHALALAGDGRKAAGLRTLERTRVALRSDLGVDPSVEFLEAESAILQNAVQIRGSAETVRPRAKRPLVGRADEVAQILHRSAQVTVVVGEAGIGKTHLLDEVSEGWVQAGNRVVRAACSENASRPLQLLGELFGQLPKEPNPTPQLAAALRRVDPALAAMPTGSAAASLTRDGLTDLLGWHLADLVTKEPALLIIDDAHWIDRSSALVLQKVIDHGDANAVLAMRPVCRETNLPFVKDPGSIEQIELGGLTMPDTTKLLSSILGSAPSEEDAADIHERSGGNPFFTEMLGNLLAEGALGTNQQLPRTVLVAVQQRIDSLSRSSTQSLLAASVLGQSIDLELLRSIRPTCLLELEEAELEGLVKIDRDGQRVDFAHALVAAGAYELLGEGQRVDLHDQVAATLAETTDRVVDFEYHASRAEMLDPERAVAGHLRAGWSHLEALSFEESLVSSQSGQALLDRWAIEDPSRLAELRYVEGESLRSMARSGSTPALLDAIEVAYESGDEDLEARAVIALCRPGPTTVAGDVHAVAKSVLARLLERGELSQGRRIEVLAASATLFGVSSEAERARLLYAEALDSAIELGDPVAEAAVLAQADFGLSGPTDVRRRTEAADRLQALAGNDPDLLWEAAYLRYSVAATDCNIEGLNAERNMVVRYSDQVIQRPRDFGTAIVESGFAHLTGDLEAAEGWADVALARGLASYPRSWAMNAYGALLLGIRRAQGRVPELHETFQSLSAEHPGFPTWRVCLAYSAALREEFDEATEFFDDLAKQRFGAVVQDGSWTAAMTLLGEVAATIDRPAEADIILELLAPFSGRLMWSGVSAYGPVDTGLAAAARATGQSELADKHDAIADKLCRRLDRLVGHSTPPPPLST